MILEYTALHSYNGNSNRTSCFVSYKLYVVQKKLSIYEEVYKNVKKDKRPAGRHDSNDDCGGIFAAGFDTAYNVGIWKWVGFVFAVVV